MLPDGCQGTSPLTSRLLQMASPSCLPEAPLPPKRLCLGLWQQFLGLCPRAVRPPVIRKGVPLPGISTKAGARYLRPSSVLSPRQALALRNNVPQREKPESPWGRHLTLPGLFHLACLQSGGSTGLSVLPPALNLLPKYGPASSFPSPPAQSDRWGLLRRSWENQEPG